MKWLETIVKDNHTLFRYFSECKISWEPSKPCPKQWEVRDRNKESLIVQKHVMRFRFSSFKILNIFLNKSRKNEFAKEVQAHQYISVPERHDLAGVRSRHKWARARGLVIATPRARPAHYTTLQCTWFQTNWSRELCTQILAGNSLKRHLLTSEISQRDRTDWFNHRVQTVHMSHCTDAFDRSDQWSWIIYKNGNVYKRKSKTKFAEAWMQLRCGRAALAAVWRTMARRCVELRLRRPQRKCYRADSTASAKWTFSRSENWWFFPDESFGTTVLLHCSLGFISFIFIWDFLFSSFCFIAIVAHKS